MPISHRFKKKFTGRLSNKHVLIWLLTIPTHPVNVTTVPCGLSLITTLVCDCHSFSDINGSQGSAATQYEERWDLQQALAANLLENLPVEEF